MNRKSCEPTAHQLREIPDLSPPPAAFSFLGEHPCTSACFSTAWTVIISSAGKDSQAMLDYVMTEFDR